MKAFTIENISKYIISSAITTIFLTSFMFSGCKKLIEVDPPIQVIASSEIYNSNATAASVLTGIYTSMSSGSVFTGGGAISLKAGLSADELITTTPPFHILSYLYTNTLTNNGDKLFWSDLYTYIYKVNTAIEGISASAGITFEVKQQLLGEARFLRAFYYFYLVNFYGDVPLLITSDIKINSTKIRTDKAKVYEQIIQDLLDAKNELNENYVAADGITSISERLRPNKSAATALLARVYLYTQQWQLAEEAATDIINDYATYQLENLSSVFFKTSKEAIWQLQPTSFGMNTFDASTFVLAIGDNFTVAGPNGGSRPVYLSEQICDAFEINDNRKTNWVGTVTVSGVTYSYAYKYKAWIQNESRTEYLMVLRLGELYLIRAEARAEQNKVTGGNSAAADLNTIRSRAGLEATVASTQIDMLNAIILERKVEFFTEWGHRWLDLKRTGKVDEVMSAVLPTKGGTWNNYKALYPIPIQDLKRNPSLKGHQNPGYPAQ